MRKNKHTIKQHPNDRQAEQWFDSYDDSQPVKVFTGDDDKERIRKEIFNKVSAEINSDNVRRLRLTILKVAAMLILACGAGLLIYNNRPAKHSLVAQTVTWKTYQANGQNTRTVILSDSSTVILKPGSSISIPSNFNTTRRLAKLVSGEAFFEVKRDTTRPFIVQSGELAVRVLGTAFTVEDNKAANSKTVAVAHGTVQVQNNNQILSVLTKGKRLKYLNATQQFSVDMVPLAMVALWSKNSMELNQASFTELAEVFKAFYNQELTTRSNEIRSAHFTLVIDKKQQAFTTLKIIAKTHGLDFKEANGKIVVTKQK